MSPKNLSEDENLVRVLSSGGIAVMPTDTLYGVVGRAEDREVVERIYAIRQRNENKPCIVLVGDMEDLHKFSVLLSSEQKYILRKYWPGPVSVVLDFENGRFSYLHRNTETLAFRLPLKPDLRALIKKVGPLVAPSANPEGLPTARNIKEAKKYFGDIVDLYMDGGELKGKPSKVIRLHEDGSMSVIRE